MEIFDEMELLFTDVCSEYLSISQKNYCKYNIKGGTCGVQENS